VGEYCHAEIFRASCGDDEVVLMERALYGRMSLGRCVELDMGHLGCQSDVLELADRRCSGRRSCLIRVPDAELESRRPCLRELKTYLFASYRCVRGALSEKTDQTICYLITFATPQLMTHVCLLVGRMIQEVSLTNPRHVLHHGKRGNLKTVTWP